MITHYTISHTTCYKVKTLFHNFVFIFFHSSSSSNTNGEMGLNELSADASMSSIHAYILLEKRLKNFCGCKAHVYTDAPFDARQFYFF